MWKPGDGGPLMLRSMLRQHLRTGSDVPIRLLYSSRSWEDGIYRDELGQFCVDLAELVSAKAPHRQFR